MNPPLLASKIVMLDAGHGGHDPGATAIDGTKESHLALAVVNALFLELVFRKYRPLRTREKDEFVSLFERANMANKAGADVFVSVHFNAALNVTAKGAWVLHAAGSGRGKKLAQDIYRALCPGQPEKVYPDASPWTNKRRLAVLRQTTMPATLIECAFLTHPGELAQIQQDGWPQKTAEKIADGIEAWFKGGPT